MCENVLMFNENLKILRFLGFNEPSTKKKLYLTCAITLLNVSGQAVFFFHAKGHFEQQIFNIFMLVVACNCQVRIYSVLLRKSKLSKIIDKIVAWFLESQDEDVSRILLQGNVKAKSFTKLVIVLAILSYIATVTHPFFLQKRTLGQEIYVPGIDVYDSPYYEIVFILQATLVVPFSISSFINYSIIMVVWLTFGTAAMKHLCQRLDRINTQPREVILEELKCCIEYHNKIIDLRNDFEDFLAPPCFMDIALFGLMLCINLFYMALVDDMVLKFIIATFNLALFLAHFFTYWIANDYTCQSLEIPDAAFNVDWTRGNKEFRQCLLLLIVRSQKALQITAGGMYPMTLVYFQAIVRMSYSYFSMLQGLL